MIKARNPTALTAARVSRWVHSLVLLFAFSTLGDFPASAQISMFGHPYPETDFVWVLDTSCSMSWGSPAPIEQLKSEVSSAIQQLGPTQHFNLVAFSSGWSVFFGGTVLPATPANRSAAIAWVSGLGTNGSTCAGSACLTALSRVGNSPSPSRALIYCGDGPSNCPSPASELALIAGANVLNTPIHTVQLGLGAAVPFLVDLAAQNGGTFRLASQPASPSYRRGDATGEGAVDLGDVIFVGAHLFLQGPAAACPDSADCDDSDALDLADMVYLLSYLFTQGPAPPYPGPLACGQWVAGPLGACGVTNCP